MSTSIEKNEWTPQLRRAKKALSPASRKRRLVMTGYKVVALLKVKMDQQKGFADNVPYAKLKIKYRYHGTKDVSATKKNLARRARGATVRTETFVKTINGVAHARQGKVIRITSKTPVTDSTKALIDTGDLRRSWDVLSATNAYVDVGNVTPLEKVKAYYNDDRGRFKWGRASEAEAMEAYLADFDRQMGFA